MSKNGCGLINANGTRSETGKQGTSSFPAGLLYEKYNLYKVPTTACWKKVHALQRRTSQSRVLEKRMHGLMREGRVKPTLYSTLYRNVPLYAVP